MIHAVWGTKNREHYIAKDVRPLLLTHIKEKCLLLQSKNLSMSTSTSYMATGTCAAPERGRGLQGWATNMQKGEVDGVIMDVERNCLKGVVIRTNWVHNNIFGVHINELCTSEKKTTTQQIDNENGILNL